MVYSLLPVLGILDFYEELDCMKNRQFWYIKKISGSRFYSSKNNSHVDSENQIQFQVTWITTSD
jgi:hypothetical protein